MQLQTKIPKAKAATHQISYQSGVLLLGSCFSEHIGDTFEYYKFKTLSNPFGIMFNPLSIDRFLQRVVKQQLYTENDVFYHNEQWHCLDAHSTLSEASAVKLVASLNKRLHATFQFLKQTTHVIITLGTAWVFDDNATKQTVANCHKLPQQQFTNRLLSSEEITTSLLRCVASIQQVNPKASVIFTVSPVRHIKNGFVENMHSKALLISAIHNTIAQQLHNNTMYYFYAYEIMMDELRDYRFYKQDMLHPNALAVNYIWTIFSDLWLSPSAQPDMKRIDAIQKGLQHKPFNTNSESYKTFQIKLQQQIADLTQRLPFIEF